MRRRGCDQNLVILTSNLFPLSPPRYTKELTLTNTSEVPMRFSWRVPSDEKSEPREWQVVPQRGAILPNGKQKIVVELVSHTVQRYATELVLDLPNVADRQAVLPLGAECAVPMLQLFSNTLDFGEVFLRQAYKAEMRVVNESKLPAKFELLPQDPNSLSLATYTAEPASGGIPARGEQVMKIHKQICMHEHAHASTLMQACTHSHPCMRSCTCTHTLDSHR
jgi:hydrocephalus-inducing protein